MYLMWPIPVPERTSDVPARQSVQPQPIVNKEIYRTISCHFSIEFQFRSQLGITISEEFAITLKPPPPFPSQI